MIIREFRKEDLKEVLRMTEEAWRKVSFDRILEEKFGKSKRSWVEYKNDSLKEFMEKHSEWVFIAEEGGKVVGHATYFLDRERKIGHVLNNAVHPNWRGKGIGGELHKKVLEELKEEGMKGAILTTFEDNIPARKMYEAEGFEELVHSIHYGKKLE